MSNWFRVPAWCGGRLCGDHKASRQEAAMDLLGRWDQGEDPSVVEMKRAWLWSWDKAAALVAEMRAWATETGARVPPEPGPGKIGSESGANREKTGRQNSAPKQVVDERPGGNREETGSESGASRERVPRSRQTETQTDEQQGSPPAEPAAPPPPPKHTAKAAPKPPADPKPAGASRLATLAWDAEFAAAFDGAAYPWLFRGRDHDGSKVKTWLEAARVDATDPEPGIGRLKGAMRAYLVAAKARQAFPNDGTGTTHWFTRDLAKWLQTDPATGPPTRAAPTNGRPAAKPSPLATFLGWSNAEPERAEEWDGPPPRQSLSAGS